MFILGWTFFLTLMLAIGFLLNPTAVVAVGAMIDVAIAHGARVLVTGHGAAAADAIAFHGL
jgi:phosphoheptose isomerase